MTTTATTTAEALAAFEAQPVLQPGQPGWWKVWGASPRDIRPGDLVFTPGTEFLVQDIFEAKAALRIGVVIDGERQTIGLGCRIILVRQGTKNTLSDSVR